MASFNLSIIVLLATVAVLSVKVQSQENTSIGSHSIFVGLRVPGDVQIYTDHISEAYSLTGQKKVLERRIQAPENNIITAVHAIDDATDGTGAEASIVSGGPGSDWVVVKFKSHRLRGVYFTLNVYAKPNY